MPMRTGGSISVTWIVRTAAIALLAAGCATSSIDAPTSPSQSIAESTPLSTATTSAGTPSLIGLVNDAAAEACADGFLTNDDLESYRDALRDIRVDPSSALSRTAVIVECGLSTSDVLDLLP